jgi:hypothetical protein
MTNPKSPILIVRENARFSQKTHPAGFAQQGEFCVGRSRGNY